VFSKWERVFANPMAAAAAIDWIVQGQCVTESSGRQGWRTTRIFDAPVKMVGVDNLLPGSG